jgi:hypothetical protein
MSRQYFGHTLTRNDTPGSRLRWSAYVNGSFVYADTLAGIRQLVRAELAESAK